MAEGTDSCDRLPELFDQIWKCWEVLEKTEEPSVSYNYQKTIVTALTTGVKAISMVNDLCLFSNNEDLDEVSTNEIKYLLLPAFMAYFTQRKVTKTGTDRMEIAKKSKTHLLDFLRNCDCYGVAKIDKHLLQNSEEVEITPANPRGPPGMQSMMRSRDEKIKSFKEKKELDTRVKELYERVKEDHVEDEVKRDYFVSVLKQWVHTSSEDLDALQFEVSMLEQRSKAQESTSPLPEEEKKEAKPKPMRPFIITKDMIQKAVFGAGYPSIPTYTIEEFYEQKVKEGSIHLPANGHSMQNWANDPEKNDQDMEREKEEKENKIEADDPVELQKAREWDDWTDDHRKGWGNRKNMG